MKALEYQKELLRHKIATQRQLSGTQLSSLKRMATPASAATSLGRLAGGRLGQLGKLVPVVSLFARGPRMKTWLRVAAVATLVVPLVIPLLSRARSRNGVPGAADPSVAE